MSKLMEFMDGKKNFLFGAILIALGGIKTLFPDLPVDGDPQTLFMTGFGWILARDAIKKVEKKK